MAQADSKPTRRSSLRKPQAHVPPRSQHRGKVAAEPRRRVRATPAAAIPTGPYPMFNAVEAHRRATEQYNIAIRLNDRLEQEIPPAKRRSFVLFDCRTGRLGLEGGTKRDDPRWLESQHDVIRTAHEIERSAWALLDTAPTTLEEVIAILAYATSHAVRGGTWPEGQREMGSPGPIEERYLEVRLIDHVAKVLARFAYVGRVPADYAPAFGDDGTLSFVPEGKK